MTSELQQLIHQLNSSGAILVQIGRPLWFSTVVIQYDLIQNLYWNDLHESPSSHCWIRYCRFRVYRF